MSMTSQKVKLELFLDAPPAFSPAPQASSPTPLQQRHHQLLLQLQLHSFFSEVAVEDEAVTSPTRSLGAPA